MEVSYTNVDLSHNSFKGITMTKSFNRKESAVQVMKKRPFM